MARRYYSSTAARTTLSSAINSSVTSIIVASVSGFPASYPYTLIIDQDAITEEIVTVTAGSGTTLTVTRGVDGSSAVAHDAGAPVNHGVSARDFDEPNAHVNDTSTNPHNVTASQVGAVATSLVDAAGDLIVGSADNTVGRLALGSNGQVLTVDTAGSGVAKLKWASAASDPKFATSATFQTSGSWSHPTASVSNPKDILVVLVGGGGGGGGAGGNVTNTAEGVRAASGGAGGAVAVYYLRTDGRSITYTVGAGGNGGTGVASTSGGGTGNNGSAGGASSITNATGLTAAGGAAGLASQGAGGAPASTNAGGAATAYGGGGGAGGGWDASNVPNGPTAGGALAYSSVMVGYDNHNLTTAGGGGGGVGFRTSSGALVTSNGASGGSSTSLTSVGGAGGNGVAGASPQTGGSGTAGTGVGAGGGGGGGAKVNANSGTATGGSGGAGAAGAVIFYYDL